MKIKCEYCDSLIDDTNINCPYCDAEIKAAAKPRQAQPQVYAQPSYSQPQAASPRRSVTAKPRRPVAFRVIAGILICVLIISASAKLLPGLISGTNVLETASAKVTANAPTATLAGVTVEVNALNLTDGEKALTVSRQGMSEFEDSGLKSVEYDISLGDTHRLKAPLTLTVPYDKKTADGGDVILVHYDRDYGVWIPLNTTDNGDGTVTASLNSLSPVRAVFLGKDYSDSLFYVSDMNTAKAQMKVNMNWWNIIKKQPLDTAVAVANGFLTNGNTDASTSWINDAANEVNTMNTYYTLFGAAGDATVSMLGEVAGASSALGVTAANASKGIGAVSLIIAGVQLAYDAANPDAAPNTAAINLLKNICTNGGTLFGLATGGGTAALSIAFFGVALFGYGLDVAVAYAQDIQKDTIKAVSDYYYENLDSFDEQDWYNMFVDAYLDAWQNGKGSADGANIAIEKVKKAIDDYAEKFWDDIYKDGNDTLSFAVAEAGRTNYFTPTAAQKQSLILGIKKDMYERFEYNVLPWIRDYMKNEMQTALYCSLLDVCAPFNEKYTIQIQENPPQDGEDFCKFHNHTVRIGFTDSFAEIDIPNTWSMQSPDDDNQWAVESNFTLMSYILAGKPNTVLLFSPENKSIDPKKCDNSVGFTLDSKMTVVELYDDEKESPKLRSIEYYSDGSPQKEYDDWADIIKYAIMESGEIEIYTNEDGTISFTIPQWTYLFNGEYITSSYSFAGMTFTGTANGDFTEGEFFSEDGGGSSIHIIGDYQDNIMTLDDFRVTLNLASTDNEDIIKIKIEWDAQLTNNNIYEEKVLVSEQGKNLSLKMIKKGG